MEDHRHKCEACGLVWAHPDAINQLSMEEQIAAHMCPKCGLGPWIAKMPKKLTKEQLRKCGACNDGIDEFFFLMEQQGEEMELSDKIVELVLERYSIDIFNNWAYELLPKLKAREYRSRVAMLPTEHNSYSQRDCEICKQKLLIFVEIYNREDEDVKEL